MPQPVRQLYKVICLALAVVVLEWPASRSILAQQRAQRTASSTVASARDYAVGVADRLQIRGDLWIIAQPQMAASRAAIR
jgi:hypothetical protein